MTAYSWNSFNPGNWSNAADWTPGGGPPRTSADSANLSFNGMDVITLDVDETIGTLTIGSAADTLDIGSNQLTVTNSGGLAGTVTVTAGQIDIEGGTLSATNGISLGAGTRLEGSGTLIGPIAGAGQYIAIDGTLRFESAVLASATNLIIDGSSATGPVIELDSTVASGAEITFSGAIGTLDLTDISGNLLQGFGGTIAGLTVSTNTVPTNQIDLAGLATANMRAASFNTSTDVLTVTTTGGSFTLQLSGSYAAGTSAYWITDGAGTGTDLFLSDLREWSWSAAGSGKWSNAADWTPSGGPPSTDLDTANLSGSSSYTVILDVNETIGALSIEDAAATLAIDSNQLTITTAGSDTGTVTVGAGAISIKGGALSAANGISLSAGTSLSGSGTLSGTIAGAGKYEASGGTLRLESAVLASATGLEIANASASILRLDSTVASGAEITFLGGAGTLDLTDISGNVLQGFGGTIAGLTVSTSLTPTNQIDLAGLAKANISAATLNTSTDVLTVTTTGGKFALQLSGSYAAGTFVDRITDGVGTGTDLFLSDLPAFSWNAAVSGNWSNAADWEPSGGPPNTNLDTANISAAGGAYTVTLDASETIGALTIGSGNATLAIGGNQLAITNAGGLAGTLKDTAGSITISGGTLSATNGLSLSAGASLSGSGTLIGTIAGAGTYQASGGTLRLESAVLASAAGLQIANNSASILELDGTVASGAAIDFAGTAGTLDLTDISNNLLQGFSGTIAGLNVGSSATVPTNQIDLAGLAEANISAASLNTTTDVLTVTTTGGSFTLQLSGSYAAGTQVGLATDGAGTGTDLFLHPNEFSWSAAVSANWSTAADWTPSGGPPSTNTANADISVAGAYQVTLDVDETIAVLSIGSGNATLAIGGNQLTVTNAGGLAGTVTDTAGNITISGGTLSATNGISLSAGASLSGTGTLIGTIAGAGTYQASGGTLDLESAVLASATGLQIADTSTSVLELDSTVASGAEITFLGADGTLDLEDYLGSGLQETIAGLYVGGSDTVSTNQVDLAGLTEANISAASLNTTTDVLTVTMTRGSFTLQLSGSYAASTQVGYITDEAGAGTDLFLFTNEFAWNTGASGNWSTAADWTTGGPPNASADTVNISVAGVYEVTLDVNETIGALTIDNRYTTLAIGGNQLAVTSASGEAGTVTDSAGTVVIMGGTLSATNGISMASGTTLYGHGTLIGTISGAGTYLANFGGTLRLEGAVQSSATELQIATAVLELDSTVASGAVITFFGNSDNLNETLDLTDISGGVLQGFGGTIAGLTVDSNEASSDDNIDLAGLSVADISAASLDTSTDVVTVTTTGGSFTLQLSGSYAAGTFVDWFTDGAGTGSNLYLSTTPCYCRGTLILTDQGERPVEELAIGDQVATRNGLRPIKWIGKRGYDGRFIRGNRDVLPVVIAAGALRRGVPARDLWVSPEHALYLDEVLVPARSLVNGMTITQAEAVDRVEYFHLEFEGHEIIVAEGAAAESYVESHNRHGFHNADEFYALYPDDDRPSFCECAPRVTPEMPVLGAIRQRLFDRAEVLGHPTTDDPDLHLVVDGEIIRPSSVVDDLYTFVLDRKPISVWLASRSAIPAELELQSTDTRRLGTGIEGIVLRDEHIRAEISHALPSFREGFHENEGPRRWTDGMALLPPALLHPFAGALTIEVRRLAARLRYPLNAVAVQPSSNAMRGMLPSEGHGPPSLSTEANDRFGS
jgi:fibronectin-binding autotransporter adhesin